MRHKKAKKLFDKYNSDWKTDHVYEHSIRVMNYASKICEELEIGGEEKKIIELAAKYHDIGKLSYTPIMLSLTRKLTLKEIKLAKKHSKYGYKILKAVHKDDSIAKLVLYHHEKIDGSGYPKGLKGEKIPFGSRIITVCDAYDAMFRHYNKKTEKEAIQELKDNSGTHFDKKIVEAFLKIKEEI